MSLEDCLPAELRGSSTTITKVAAGLSGAGVYRVDAAGGAFVLKISASDEPVDAWRRKRDIQQLAADAGVAPRIVHVDETRRAVVSDFVVDRSFPALFGTPATRDTAIDLVGRTLRRVHEIPLPADASSQSPKEFLAATWSGLESRIAIPQFVVDAVRGVLAAEAGVERELVLSHNDVNPTNIVYDGERLLLLDWDTSGANDPLYDLAVISVFLLMDEPSCKRLLAAHDDAPVTVLPSGFMATRRMAATLSGVMFLRLSAGSGYADGTGDETFESVASLGELYGRMRSGSLNVATGEGQRLFGLALVKESLTS